MVKNKQSIILCFKGLYYSKIVCKFLKRYSLINKIKYKEIDLTKIKSKNGNKDTSLILIQKIEDIVNKYDNILLYYLGVVKDKKLNLNIEKEYNYYNFPCFENNNNEIEIYNIINYFVNYDPDKKIITFCDCSIYDNIKYIDNFNLIYEKKFLNLYPDVNIFDIINNMNISSNPYENILGLFTFNLFIYINLKDEGIKNILQNENIICDLYNI